MKINTQSLYRFFNDNRVLKIKPLRATKEAKIIKFTKMKDQNPKEVIFQNIDKNIYIDKLLDGIYKADIVEETNTNGVCKKRSYYLTVKNKKLVRQTSKYPRKLSGEMSPFENTLYRNNKIIIPESDWLKLIDFYIVKNPSLDRNGKPSTTQYFDIKKDWGHNCWQRGDTLKTKLIETLPNYKHIVRIVDGYDDMKKPLKELKIDKFEDIVMGTRICVVDSCSNIFLSIFRHIRNSLAHGRFISYKIEDSYFLLLEDTNRNYVTARMVFDVSILLKWIDIIKKLD